MPNTTITSGNAAFAAILTCLLSASTTAQQVLLSEVRADASERWIELHNRGSQTVDLSTWSLHHATRTPGMPRNYWWGFPTGTTLAAGAFLRVHWYQNAPSGVLPAGEHWTGTSPFGFLFGLGGETLRSDRGALGLLRTQDNANMNDPTYVADWVGWGDHAFSYEWMAVAAGVWQPGRALPSLAPTTSVARDPATIGVATFADQQWFVDFTPTPLQPNVDGALVASYGTPCALPGHHLLGAPVLRGITQPLLGNAQFALAVDHTTGIYGEYLLLAFSAAAAAPGLPSILPPYAGQACLERIDTQQLLVVWLVPTQIIATPVPLSLAGLPASAYGVELHAQALVLDLLPMAYPPYQGLSNALRIVVGQ
jgi:Lamin Tail Domain